MKADWRAWALRILVTITVLFILLASVALVLRKDVTARIGGEIQIDDFAFQVSQAESRETSVRGIQTYVIKLTVYNRAKRVEFQFNPECAIIGGENFSEASFDPSQTAALGPLDLSPMPAGTSRTYALAFKLPSDARGKYFRVCWGPGTDWLEAIFFGNKRVLLD
jgi:hypothetical protein